MSGELSAAEYDRLTMVERAQYWHERWASSQDELVAVRSSELRYRLLLDELRVILRRVE